MKTDVRIAVQCPVYLYEVSCLTSNAKGQRLSRAIATCGPNDSGLKCRDCNNLMYCKGGQQLSTIPCSQQTPGRPYCNSVNNTCVESLPSCSLNSYVCPGPGLFPNPDNCSTYYYCENYGPSAEIRSCLYNSVFDIQGKRCRSNMPCVSLTEECNGSNRILPYSLDESKYIICLGLQQPLLMNCPNYYYPFNPISLSCEFKCRYEGFFKNIYNPRNYYTCVLKNNVLIYVENSCGYGKIFDEYNGICRSDGSAKPTTSISSQTPEP